MCEFCAQFQRFDIVWNLEVFNRKTHRQIGKDVSGKHFFGGGTNTMSAIILDGKSLAQQIEVDLTQRVTRIREAANGVKPILATILVGDDPASAHYVRQKGNACRRIGMDSRQVFLPQETSTGELLEAIDTLANDAGVNGILLQHPVPPQIDERACFDRIPVEKDVDGVSSQGFGRMAMKSPAYGSATPAGIMRMLQHYALSISGLHAVVVGRSPILGKPMAAMLLNADSTVTVCHSKTKDLPEIVRQADLVVGAVGKPEFIKADWIKDGTIVVDAGYNPGPIGDIELEPLKDRCRAYTPVPGGVGPMTIATLLEQTVEAAEKILSAT